MRARSPGELQAPRVASEIMLLLLGHSLAAISSVHLVSTVGRGREASSVWTLGASFTPAAEWEHVLQSRHVTMPLRGHCLLHYSDWTLGSSETPSVPGVESTRASEWAHVLQSGRLVSYGPHCGDSTGLLLTPGLNSSCLIVMTDGTQLRSSHGSFLWPCSHCMTPLCVDLICIVRLRKVTFVACRTTSVTDCH